MATEDAQARRRLTQDDFDYIHRLDRYVHADKINEKYALIGEIVGFSVPTVRYALMSDTLDGYTRLRRSHDSRFESDGVTLVQHQVAPDSLQVSSATVPRNDDREIVELLRDNARATGDVARQAAMLVTALSETNRYLFRMAQRQLDETELLKRLLAAWEGEKPIEISNNGSAPSQA